MGRKYSTNVGEENCIKDIGGKEPLGRPRRRWKNSNKLDLREVGWGGMDWIDLV
jgi:hypothetical protein